MDIVYGGGNFFDAGLTDTLRITLGKGNGIFSPSYTTSGLSSIAGPIYVSLADINQNRNLEIVIFDFLTRDLYYFLGNGAIHSLLL